MMKTNAAVIQMPYINLLTHIISHYSADRERTDEILEPSLQTLRCPENYLFVVVEEVHTTLNKKHIHNHLCLLFSDFHQFQ